MRERRRHQRFYMSIPIECRVKIPGSRKIVWIINGILKNVCYGGAYFRSDDTSPIEQGQVRDFIIRSKEEFLDFPGIALIRAKGRIVRIEPPQEGSHDIGVALEFFSEITLWDEFG